MRLGPTEAAIAASRGGPRNNGKLLCLPFYMLLSGFATLQGPFVQLAGFPFPMLDSTWGVLNGPFTQDTIAAFPVLDNQFTLLQL